MAATTSTEPLERRKCVPCEGGTPPLTRDQAEPLLAQVSQEWKIEGSTLIRTFRFHDFKASIAFVNQVAEIAEQEGHHPDLHISWNKVRVELTTHAIHGLSENDFILAAKIDKLIGD
jgi:4a-hydroxytetrahydrobiopterin dehydratase